MTERPRNARLAVKVAESMFGGAFSNMALVWHTADEFTLDFLSTGMPVEAKDETDDVLIEASVVARVKVPTSVIFKIAQAIAENVDQYEKEYGPISMPSPKGGAS